LNWKTYDREYSGNHQYANDKTYYFVVLHLIYPQDIMSSIVFIFSRQFVAFQEYFSKNGGLYVQKILISHSLF
jgi:hypothetical protein